MFLPIDPNLYLSFSMRPLKDMVSIQRKTFKRTTFSAKKNAQNAQPRKYISPSPSASVKKPFGYLSFAVFYSLKIFAEKRFADLPYRQSISNRGGVEDLYETPKQ
jgi:hypothetical protein